MSTRQNKVAELLKEEVSIILQREFKDPRLGFVTVTDAEVAADMRYAKVFVSVMGDQDERKKSLKVLKNASAFVRQAVGKRVSMKSVPEITFVLDESADQSLHIMELLEQIKKNEHPTDS
jgi:ribosome-binding factor A